MVNSRLIIGVDDAGRGCIMGPLVIAGISMPEYKATLLAGYGVKDSKLLRPDQRERLYDVIMSLCSDVSVEMIPAERIDEFVRHKKKHTKLNYLEAIHMAKVINKLAGEVAYVDASDTDISLFAEQISSSLTRKIGLVATHHADRLFVVSSAASIVAKVVRDREIEMIKSKIGDFGSGYPSDPKTLRFLRNWLEEHEDIPPYSRKTWKTWKRITVTKGELV
ncbi:MAG: ribonuclease HII [Conexivisphaerales archaeon]